jgi:hypothetical protein
MEVDVFCVYVKKSKKKRNEERRETEENGKKMLTGRVMIVFLCFPSSSADKIPIN